MKKKIGYDSWVYVLIQDPGNNEHVVGQEDAENGLAFIPAFIDKDAAMQGIAHMAKEKGHKYEIQAILFESLIDHAKEGNFLIFVLDEEGTILEKFNPEGNPI